MTAWTREHLAWLAGLLEGEGSFLMTKAPYYRPKIQMQMSDEDVVRKAHEVAGVGTVCGPFYGLTPAGKARKPTWIWGVNRQKDAYALMVALVPWLGVRRCESIRNVLVIWDKHWEPQRRDYHTGRMLPRHGV